MICMKWISGFTKESPISPLLKKSRKVSRRLCLLLKVLFAQVTGETLRSVSRRAAKSWAEISAQKPAGNVLIVSHGVLIIYLLKYLLDEQVFKTLEAAAIKPCSITELIIGSAGDAQLKRFNDTAHLTNPEHLP